MITTQPNYKLTRLACYTAYFTMSSIFCVPPLLFMILREEYGISYTLLGTLVLINFCTQLAIDLIFTLFSKHFNTKLTVRLMPVITSVGLLIYALVPRLFPSLAYPGLVVGTVIFSVSAGLSEVLLSPTIAAMPSDNPQRDMSFLHSLYAFGVVTMVLISTAFLGIFGKDSWVYLVTVLAALPLIAAVLFALSPMPDMSASVSEGGTRASKKQAIGLLLSVLCIFFGSCAENAMSNWISGYMESALGVDKSFGDVFGVAMFAVLLGVARITYSRIGRRIEGVLLVGMIGAAVCYLTAALVPITAVAFAACILTGLFTAMLWPGSLIFMEENVPGVGVGAFALMAAGGDFGASLAPQLLGAIADAVSASGFGASLASQLGIGAEQLGLKAGMLVCAVFPALGIITVIVTVRYFRKARTGA